MGVVDCGMCETYKSLLKKRVNDEGKGCSRTNLVLVVGGRKIEKKVEESKINRLEADETRQQC